VKRLAVLASGTGTNLQALLDATSSGVVDAEVVVVVSDRANGGALERAKAAGAAAVWLPLASRHDPQAREAYDRHLADVVSAFRPDLVVLAGWMLICSPAFLERFAGRIVNVHPALLPDEGGDEVPTSHGPLPALRGRWTVRDALALGLPITGASVHYVTTEVDAGPLIVREEVPIYRDDDEERLHARIKEVEHRLLPRAVAMALAEIEGKER
jgi:phosphoribosylglycinamide formyltransferase-1